MDVVSREQRSAMMSGIRAKDTRPELLVRKYLYQKGFRYRLHVRRLPGTPDLVIARLKVCVFVHGCFWHRHKGCRLAYTPKSRVEFWLNKFAANVARHEKAVDELLLTGWRVIVLWECGLRNRSPDVLDCKTACKTFQISGVNSVQ